MADRRTLLHRLHRPAADTARSAEDDARDVEASILSNLRRLFNTQQGMSAATPEYGLPDLTRVVREVPDSTQRLEQVVRQAIERYEPRLRQVRVVAMPALGTSGNPLGGAAGLAGAADDPLHIDLVVEAQVAMPRTRARVSFRTVVNAAGRVAVKE